MITIHNDKLTAQIDEKGAQLCSVKNTGGVEYIWQADPRVWGRHAPLLFPFIGRLKDSRYTLNGREYQIGSHGFARDSVFTVAAQDEHRASFVLESSPETLAMWPYEFRLTVTFELVGNRLVKTCTVENPNGETMYYELGHHDGFNAALAPGEVMADYAVCLPGVDSLHPYGMDESAMMTPKSREIPLDRGRINLKPMTYGLDTIVLDEFSTKSVRLVDKSGKARVTLDFEDYTYLGIWTMDQEADTNYVCLEPWSSLPDATFVGRDLTEKAHVRSLAAGQQESLSYTVTFD